LEILQQFENAAALRDLHHSEGWKVYVRLSKERIDQLTKEYLRENLTHEEAWEAHIRIRAIMQFEAQLEEMVVNAVDLVDPQALEDLMLSLRQNRDIP